MIYNFRAWLLWAAIEGPEFEPRSGHVLPYTLFSKGHFTYTPKPNRKWTEKIKCLNPMCAFTYAPKSKPNRTPSRNVHDFDFIFFGFVGWISANSTSNLDKICTYTIPDTTTCVVYTLVIMKAIAGLSSETIVRLFFYTSTILLTTDFCGTIHRATIKTTNLGGRCFQKLLLVWHFSCININGYFIKETDTFGYIDIWTIYTFHTDHFTPHHTAFEHSAACLSVVLNYFLVLFRLHYCDTLGELYRKTFT